MQLPGAVGRDDDNRRCGSANGPELGNRHLVVGQQLEQIPLELFVGAVELVDQQHRRSVAWRFERSQQRSLDEEVGSEQIGRHRGRVDRPTGLTQPDLEQLSCVVPLVHGVGDVEPFIALQSDELCIEPGGEHLRHLGLADSRLAFE